MKTLIITNVPIILFYGYKKYIEETSTKISTQNMGGLKINQKVWNSNKKLLQIICTLRVFEYII